MNDNHPERPDDRTAAECERHEEEATTAALLAAARVAEIRATDPQSAHALMRIIAKLATGAVASGRRAKALRS